MSKKFSVNTKLFVRELTFVKESVGGVNPLWGNVVITTGTGHATMVGINGSSSASTTFSADVQDVSTFAILASKLLEVARLIHDETVTFSETDTRITVSDSRSKYVFNKIPQAVESIKVAQQVLAAKDGTVYQFDKHIFLRALDVAQSFAADEEKSQYSIAGVRLDFDDKAVYARAMNGFRAVDAVFEDKADGRSEGGIYIGKDYLPLVKQVVDVVNTVSVAISQDMMQFTNGNRVATIRRATVENFPKVAAHIAKFYKENPNTALVDSKSLQEAVKRAAAASDGKTRKVLLGVKNSTLSLRASDALGTVQDFEENVPADTTGSGDCSLNGVDILEFLKYVSGAVTVRIGTDASHPVIITNDSGLRCMASQMK